LVFFGKRKIEIQMSLNLYKRRRNFSLTPEPDGEQEVLSGNKLFVVQRHDTSVLHYDLRIEVNGVLKSWAIPRGPSMNPGDRRLAICMEDHPLSYAFFKGRIPAGNYGAGMVDIWDRGRYVPYTAHSHDPDKQIIKQLKCGNLKFSLKGKFLKGVFSLVRIPGINSKLWVLLKGNDKFAVDYTYDSEEIKNYKVTLSRRTFSHWNSNA
jgi:bifunctional non-homologous end joining protein LigD